MMASLIPRPMALLLAGSALIATSSHLTANRGDFWIDASQTFSVAASPTATIDKRASAVITSDYTRKSTGDCSVRVDLAQGKSASASVLMIPGPYRESWAVGTDWVFLTPRAGTGMTLTRPTTKFRPSTEARSTMHHPRPSTARGSRPTTARASWQSTMDAPA